MAHRISVTQWRERNNIPHPDESQALSHHLAAMAKEGIEDALCSKGCMVEPGTDCPHGFPSVVITLMTQSLVGQTLGNMDDEE